MNTLIGPTVKHVRNDTVFVLLILLGLQFITWAIKEIHALTVFLCLTFSRTNSLKPWNSLEEGDEASQKPNLRPIGLLSFMYSLCFLAFRESSTLELTTWTDADLQLLLLKSSLVTLSADLQNSLRAKMLIFLKLNFTASYKTNVTLRTSFNLGIRHGYILL